MNRRLIDAIITAVDSIECKRQCGDTVNKLNHVQASYDTARPIAADAM